MTLHNNKNLFKQAISATATQKGLPAVYIEKTWNQIEATYNSTFKMLVFGELPPETAILNTLNKVSTRLKSIKWTIELSKISPNP